MIYEFLKHFQIALSLQLATSKGFVAGDLDFTEHDGNHVDCRGTSNVGFMFIN